MTTDDHLTLALGFASASQRPISQLTECASWPTLRVVPRFRFARGNQSAGGREEGSGVVDGVGGSKGDEVVRHAGCGSRLSGQLGALTPRPEHATLNSRGGGLQTDCSSAAVGDGLRGDFGEDLGEGEAFLLAGADGHPGGLDAGGFGEGGIGLGEAGEDALGGFVDDGE